MGIGDLWAGGGGTVYIQGHPVIPNPWGDTVINGTTTTTTDDTTEKGGFIPPGITLPIIISGILDLCECDPPPGFKLGVISGDFTGKHHNEGHDTSVEEMSCEQLGNAMQWAKDEYDFINNAYHDGKYGNIGDENSAMKTFEKDPDNCRTMSFDICNYWTAQNELRRRQDRGECLDISIP
jgi:hypothetical protein